MPFLDLAGHHSNQNPYPSYSAPPVRPPPVPVPPPPPPPPETQLPMTQVTVQTPTSMSHFTSTLSASYHQQYVFEEEEYNNTTETDQLHSTGYYVESSSLSHNIGPYMSSHQSGLVRHYLDHVLRRQYLLADTSIAEFIIRTVQENPAARDAVCLLASLHRESLRHGHNYLPAAAAAMSDALVVQNDASTDYSKTYKRICASLSTSAAGGYTEGEAMAGLFVVSAFLFRGGRGAWQEFLSVAADWVWNVLHSGGSPAETIMHCSDSQQFIIKTTFWFDILASTTRLQSPRFLATYRELWSSRRGAYIEGGSRQHQPQQQPSGPLSMMSVMGCENSTALAIAEISALACWKEAHARQGTLSVPELVDRGRTIESECLVHPSPTPAHPSASGLGGGGDGVLVTAGSTARPLRTSSWRRNAASRRTSSARRRACICTPCCRASTLAALRYARVCRTRSSVCAVCPRGVMASSKRGYRRRATCRALCSVASCLVSVYVDASRTTNRENPLPSWLPPLSL
jgi:hypothetical protein